MTERCEECHNYETPRQAAREFLEGFYDYLQRRNFDLRMRSPTSGQKDFDTLISGFIETITPLDSD